MKVVKPNMDKTGVRVHNKGRGLIDDEVYQPCACQNHTNIKQSDLLSIICAVICTFACIVTVSCSLYCNKAQTDVREQYENSGPFVYETARVPSSHRGNGVKHDIGKKVKDMDTFKTILGSDLKKEELLQHLDSYNSNNERLTSDVKGHIRIRRADADLKTCRKNCKGTRIEKRNCKRECKKKFGTVKPRIITIPTQVNLPAVHFEANTGDRKTQTLVGDVYSKFRKSDEGPLQIFKQADWVDASSPIELNKDSVAVVKSSGIFLVYAQVFIGGSGTEKAFSVIHKKGDKQMNDELTCYTGRYTETYLEQTCSVLGLMKLEQGDTVEVQRGDATKEIEIDADKTFFGMVQLSGIVLK